MPATMLTAKREVLTLLKAAFDGGTETPTKVLWPDVSGSRPEAGGYWAEVMIRTVTSQQTSLSGQHTNYGMLFVDLYYPAGDGQTTLSTLAQEIVDGLRGKHTDGGVWFRSVTPREVGQSGPWYQFTVTANFEYDQY